MSTELRRPSGSPSREQFVTELAERRAASGKSFSALARELDHPRSTLHGWCRGDHLPFPRDDEVFVRLLGAIGVDDPEPWLRALRALRRRTARINPYHGLEPFTEDDTEGFHGRTALVERLVGAVDASADGRHGLPLVVIGASGSGKTSLLRAGLVARLNARDGHATAVITPGADPLDRIERTLTRLTGARAATLVIDQFEELFTLAPDDAVEPVVAAIAGARRARIHVVLGVRSDFFHHVAAVPYLLDALDRSQILVGPMSTVELTEAIVAPAQQVGLRVEPNLLAHLLREFDGHTHRSRGTHALPLLSHVLYQLAGSASGDVLRLSDYRAIGGLADALQRTADESLDSLPGRLHDTCRALFLQLVELRSDTTPTRRRASGDVLERIGDPDDVRVVLETFTACRLLTVEQDAVTLSHEALLTAWPTLRDWVDEQRDELLIRRRVGTAHRTWQELGRPADGLLRGSLLDEALRLTAGQLRSSLGDDEVAFIAASSAERDASLARDAAVLSRQVAAQSDLLGARDPSLSGHLALEAIGIAETPEARSSVLQCGNAAAGPRFVGAVGPSAVAAAPGRGVAMAVFHTDGRSEWFEHEAGVLRRRGRPGPTHARAHAVSLDATGRRAVVGSRDGVVAVVEDGRSSPLPGPTFAGAAYVVRISPDGTCVVAAGSAPGVVRWRHRDGDWQVDGTIERHTTTFGLAVRWDDDLTAIADADGTVSLWDAHGRRCWSVEPVRGHPAAGSVAWSPDGRTLVAGYHDGSVRVWRVDDPTAPEERRLGSATFATWVNAIEFSPDGALLAAASSDGTVRLWDATSWRELRIELRHPSVVSGLAFVTDRSLVTSSEDGIIRTWDVEQAVTGSDASIWSTVFADDGRTLVTASRVLVAIDRGDGPRRERRSVAAPEQVPLLSGTADVSPDGRLVAVGTRTGDVVLLDGRSGAPIRTLTGGLGPLVEGIALVGRAVVAIDSTGRLHRWELSGEVPEVEVAADDGCVVAAGTALSVAHLGGDGLDDGLVGVPTEPGELVVVDVTPGRAMVERARFRTGDAFPISVARRPGRPTIVTGGADRAVSVWSVTDWEHPALVARLLGPAGHVMTIDVDPTGSRLAAGTTDGRIWIWSWEGDDGFERWATVETGEAGVYALRFSPDGRYLVSAGPNQRVSWWPLDVGAAAEVVRRRTGDPLTELERSRLMPSGTDA